MGKDVNSRISELLLGIISSLSIAFMLMTASPQNPVSKASYVDMDSAVFRTVAYMMNRGYMPYKDSFDHKGPLIYLINYLGDQVISDVFGLWLIEVLFLAATILIIYYTARLFLGRTRSFLVAMTSISLIMLFFEKGNFVEEYALPFIALSNYIFLDYLINSKVSPLRIFLCGASLGAVLMLRPNMIALWIVFGVAVTMRLIRRKEVRLLIRYILLLLGGALIVMIPVIIWLGINGALSYFWNDYIVFNFLYLGNDKNHIFDYRIKTLIEFGKNPVIILSLLASAFLAVRNKDKVMLCAFCYELLSFVLIVIPGRLYTHYGLMMVPCVIYPLCALYNAFDHIPKAKVKHWTENIFAAVLTLAFIIPGWLVMGLTFYDPALKTNDMDEYYRKSAEKVAGIVTAETSPRDKIFVFGNWDCIYLMTDRMHATKYSYQYPPCYLSLDLMNDCYQELESQKPGVIVVQAGQYNMISWFLEEGRYRLIWSEDPGDLLGSISVFKLE